VAEATAKDVDIAVKAAKKGFNAGGGFLVPGVQR